MSILTGKVAVVTGVTSPLGQAIAARLAAEGADVAVTGRTPAKLQSVAEALHNGRTRWMAEAVDLTSPEAVDGFFWAVAEQLGPVSILVNGAAWRARQSFLETTPADWRQTMASCVDSYFYCGQAAARQMIPRRWGRIIHIGSITGSVLMAPFTAYTVAKAAVNGLATGMACDLAPYGITVNVVSPGVVESPYVRENLTAEQIEKRLERIPVGRLATPEEIAAAVAHFASPDMGYVTGQTLFVDGGFLRAGVLTR